MDFSKIDLKDHQELARTIIKEACGQAFAERREFEKFRNRIIKRERGRIFHNLYFIRAYKDLIKEGIIEENTSLLSFIQKRAVRTMSGVAPVTVMTKPFPCPGRCIYCPTDIRMPKSYLPSQPAAQRGFRQRFNPYSQVSVRLKAMAMTGHEVSKVELRILGGTWSSYPKRYQKWFVKQCLLAMNEFTKQIGDSRTDNMENLVSKTTVETKKYGKQEVNTVIIKPFHAGQTFDEVVLANESSDVKCIGVNVETRPDFIDEKEVKWMRSMGITKLEIGVQTTDDRVQEITKRGHDLQSVRDATVLIKDAGFKLSYHMMPNLPGATVEGDKKMIGELFADDKYQPDYLKLYPCVVMPDTGLSLMYQRGEHKTYDDETLEEVLYAEMKDVPYWCRVDRVARDIPAGDIEAGSTVSNIRQILEKRMNEEGCPSKDIRSREIYDGVVGKAELILRSYDASGGVEHFISYEDVKQDKLIALLRLRFPGRTYLSELKGAAIVREVHVYGKQVAVGRHAKGKKQHVGWGTKLLMEAEEMASKAGFKRMAIIAGIGTRGYYAKKGYKLQGTYMVRDLGFWVFFGIFSLISNKLRWKTMNYLVRLWGKLMMVCRVKLYRILNIGLMEDGGRRLVFLRCY
ncbi:tRNA uridine(34) 5-carboxymethylaminomethyl modification radical SAM/GNAT enzyme Elp3 [Candidatus Gracilibacteria bacterium]|nr:tRNA uridine(34) 5-carboxymethylaminomethyl modification radical SAM/GNAT enzyme Elp3 [Candidatus Gracilibacteria bacterium]